MHVPNDPNVQEELMSTSAFTGPSYGIRNRVARATWNTVYTLLFRPSPRPCHAWRAMLLRVFGAELGDGCHIYPKATIWAPWNLRCEDHVGVADGAVIYNPSIICLKSHAVISQDAYLCGASHDFNHPSFPLVSGPIEVGRYAWICARATVQMNVTVGEGAVLALGAIATRDLAEWMIHAGIPAKAIKSRDYNRFMKQNNDNICC